MVLFKVNGERNSGTNFLFKILRLNNFPSYDSKRKKNIIYHWKHGIPRSDYKGLDKKVVDLFIFRNLNDWLLSFFNNPYHVKRYSKLKDFLTLPQESNANYLVDYKTNKCLNKDDNGKTIFQIREYKFNKIMEYKKKNKNVIFVNLTYIQNPKNLSKFLYFLANKYIPKLKVNNYRCIIPHTKDKSTNKNRTYKIDINKYKNIIDYNKNDKIENFINNLTFI